MVALMQHLKRKALNHQLTILAINSTVASAPSVSLSVFAATKSKPALGPTFTYLCDTTVLLSPAKDLLLQTDGAQGKVIIIEVLRARSCVSLPSPAAMCVELILSTARFDLVRLRTGKFPWVITYSIADTSSAERASSNRSRSERVVTMYWVKRR